MDVQAMASQLMGFLGDNPNLISQFASHPYSTTAQATHTQDTISKDDMSQILAQVAAQTTGQSFGQADIASIASNLLGQNGGSIHALANSLFGGAAASNASAASAPAGNASAGNPKPSNDIASMAQIAINSAIGGVAARGMAELIAGALGANKKQAKK